MKGYIHNLIVASSQFLNALLCGFPDETLSARAWRRKNKSLMFFINSIFFWQNNHCRGAYAQEMNRKHQHKEYK